MVSLLELGEIPSPTNKVQTSSFLSNNAQASLVITTKCMADVAGMQSYQYSCRITDPAKLLYSKSWCGGHEFREGQCVYIPGGWGIKIYRIANGKHPVSPGSEGVKGNPSPDAATDLCNGEGTIFLAVQ